MVIDIIKVLFLHTYACHFSDRPKTVEWDVIHFRVCFSSFPVSNLTNFLDEIRLCLVTWSFSFYFSHILYWLVTEIEPFIIPWNPQTHIPVCLSWQLSKMFSKIPRFMLCFTQGSVIRFRCTYALQSFMRYFIFPKQKLIWNIIHRLYNEYISCPKKRTIIYSKLLSLARFMNGFQNSSKRLGMYLLFHTRWQHLHFQ